MQVNVLGAGHVVSTYVQSHIKVCTVKSIMNQLLSECRTSSLCRNIKEFSLVLISTSVCFKGKNGYHKHIYI